MKTAKTHRKDRGHRFKGQSESPRKPIAATFTLSKLQCWSLRSILNVTFNQDTSDLEDFRTMPSLPSLGFTAFMVACHKTDYE